MTRSGGRRKRKSRPKEVSGDWPGRGEDHLTFDRGGNICRGGKNSVDEGVRGGRGMSEKVQ